MENDLSCFEHGKKLCNNQQEKTKKLKILVFSIDKNKNACYNNRIKIIRDWHGIDDVLKFLMEE